MTTTSTRVRELLQMIDKLGPIEETFEKVMPRNPESIQESVTIPSPLSWTEDARQDRLDFLEKATGVRLNKLTGKEPVEEAEELRGNIENFIGMTQVPTGIMGPLLVNGTMARGEFYVPMATTEGALVASYNRGAKATRLSGGITSVCLVEGVQRSPVFKFDDIPQIGRFMYWVLDQMPAFHQIVSQHSHHAKIEDMKINMEGNQVLLIFEYLTGEAAGQNMVTICTDAICRYIDTNSPIKPRHWFVESNYSGDKKATAVSYTSVRGKKVSAECHLPGHIVTEVLRSTPEMIAEFWRTSAVAAVQSGAIGIQGHFANGLTALFMATGQDVACVAEAAMGVTRMETTPDGGLYASVTLPNIIVGTVGGGTRLSTQRECLQLLGCSGPGSARKLAEICAATLLAGELSIIAAVADGHFAKAHKLFGRRN